MKKELIEIEVESKELYYYEDGKRIVVDRSKSTPEHITGYTDNIYGDMSGISGYVGDIRGDVSGIRGRVRDIYGDVSFICGDVSNIYGDASNIIGNIDDCKITDKERKKRVDIDDLVKLKVGKNKLNN